MHTSKVGPMEGNPGSDKDRDSVRCGPGRLLISLGSLNDGMKMLLEFQVHWDTLCQDMYDRRFHGKVPLRQWVVANRYLGEGRVEGILRTKFI